MSDGEKWRVSRKNPRRVTANGRVVTTTYHSNNGLGVTPLQAQELTRAISDARLIAAAPDLLEALSTVLDLAGENESRAFQDMDCPYHRARAAIKKALQS